MKFYTSYLRTVAGRVWSQYLSPCFVCGREVCFHSHITNLLFDMEAEQSTQAHLIITCVGFTDLNVSVAGSLGIFWGCSFAM